MSADITFGMLISQIIAPLVMFHISGSSTKSLPGLSKSEYTMDGIIPHCSKTVAVTAELKTINMDSKEAFLRTNIDTKLQLKQTTCFQVYFDIPPENLTSADEQGSNSRMFYSRNNGSLLYAFQFHSMVQSHPVRSHYTFAIPRVTSTCKCDCPGGEDHCNSNYRYQNCSTVKNSTCYQTYHPHQSSRGCTKEGEAELCCQVTMYPDLDHVYEAYDIGQPETDIILQYHMFEVKDSDKFELLEQGQYTVPINRGQFFAAPENEFEVFIDAREPVKHLAEGTYFTKVSDSEVRTGIPINANQLHTTNRLGWFRQSDKDKSWFIRNGPIRMQQMHHATVVDCQKQLYSDLYNAEFLRNDGQQYSNLGINVEDYYSWISSSKYLPSKDSRNVIIGHKAASPISLNIQMKGKSQIIFGYHESHLKDFSGTIRLDKHSNRFMNITFHDALGTLIGTIYDDVSRRRLVSVLSVYLDNREHKLKQQRFVELPSVVNTAKYVCLYPTNKPESEICRSMEMITEPMQWFSLKTVSWSDNEGECEGCNKVSASNFLKFLDPKQWFDGISSPVEGLALGVEIAFYAVIAIIAIAVIRKFIIPVVRWLLCGSNKVANKT